MVIIFLTPLFDNYLCFVAINEQPPIQTFSLKGAVKALHETFSRVLVQVSQYLSLLPRSVPLPRKS